MLPPEENPQNLGAFALNLRFPGQFYDFESNLHYNYFRDYDASTGRYVQSDPIGLEEGINTYAHVGSAPAMYADPEGLQAPPLVLPRPVPLPAPSPSMGGPRSRSPPVLFPRQPRDGGSDGAEDWNGIPCRLTRQSKLTTLPEPPYPGSCQQTTLNLCEYECTTNCGTKFKFIRTIGTGDSGCPTTQSPRPGDNFFEQRIGVRMIQLDLKVSDSARNELHRWVSMPALSGHVPSISWMGNAFGEDWDWGFGTYERTKVRSGSADLDTKRRAISGSAAV
jgi:RHS repeat-associated protein